MVLVSLPRKLEFVNPQHHWPCYRGYPEGDGEFAGNCYMTKAEAHWHPSAVSLRLWSVFLLGLYVYADYWADLVVDQS